MKNINQSLIELEVSHVKELCEITIKNILSCREVYASLTTKEFEEELLEYNSMPWYQKIFYTKPIHDKDRHSLDLFRISENYIASKYKYDRTLKEAKDLLVAVNFSANNAKSIFVSVSTYSELLAWNEFDLDSFKKSKNIV